jgi:hypothetical protein
MLRAEKTLFCSLLVALNGLPSYGLETPRVAS